MDKIVKKKILPEPKPSLKTEILCMAPALKTQLS
jgi:hypothetical protein